MLEVEGAPFVKVRQVRSYKAFVYINRIIFDYNELKKEKKDIANPENQDLAEVKKDYQQEEDKDVKEKSKMTKVIIAISLFIVIFFVILLIWYVKDHSVKEVNYKVDGDQAAPVIAQADEQTGSEQVTSWNLA